MSGTDMNTPTPACITVEHRPDGSMTLAMIDLVHDTETVTVLDETERRSLLRGIVNASRDVRGYVVLTSDPHDPGRYDVNWDGRLYAKADAAEKEAGEARQAWFSPSHPEAHVGMVLAVLGGPDDQMPARSAGPDRCLDCGCLPGQPHLDGCDMARCVATGEQRATYEHRRRAGYTPADDHDCGHDVWLDDQESTR